MPTKDELAGIDTEHCRELLRHLATHVREYGALYVVQEFYELCIILISSAAGSKKARDSDCVAKYPNWKALLNARNFTSHNAYDVRKVSEALDVLQESNMIPLLCRDYLSDEGLANPILMQLILVEEDLRAIAQ